MTGVDEMLNAQPQPASGRWRAHLVRIPVVAARRTVTFVWTSRWIRGSRWAHKALYTVVGWFGLVGLAVAAMAITMRVNDEPNASLASVAFMSVLGAAFVMLALFVFRPLLRPEAR